MISKGKTTPVTFRATENIKHRLQDIAERQERPVAYIVAKAVVRYLEEEEKANG